MSMSKSGVLLAQVKLNTAFIILSDKFRKGTFACVGALISDREKVDWSRHPILERDSARETASDPALEGAAIGM